MANNDICIWRIDSDGSYRVRIVGENTAAALSILAYDSYWHEVVAGLKPVHRITIGEGRNAVAVVRAFQRTLGVDRRSQLPVIWSNGIQTRRSGTFAGLAELTGLDPRDVSRMVRYGYTVYNGFAAYEECAGGLTVRRPPCGRNISP